MSKWDVWNLKTYSVDIENGIKTALYGLQVLMENENIVNDQLLRITGELEILVDKAQQGQIENDITALVTIVTEKQLAEARKVDPKARGLI